MYNARGIMQRMNGNISTPTYESYLPLKTSTWSSNLKSGQTLLSSFQAVKRDSRAKHFTYCHWLCAFIRLPLKQPIGRVLFDIRMSQDIKKIINAVVLFKTNFIFTSATLPYNLVINATTIITSWTQFSVVRAFLPDHRQKILAYVPRYTKMWAAE